MAIDIKVKLLSKSIKITIGDNGIGIDLKKYKDRVFELYQRFMPNYAPGRSLSLFIMKSQVYSMEGKIEMDSKLTKGTKITITLPQNSIVREDNLTITKRI